MIYSIMSTSEGSNCYIVKDEKTVLIDSGIDPLRIMREIDSLDITLDFIIVTHCHYDHIAGIPRIKDETGAKLLVHELDASAMEEGDSDIILSNFFSNELIKVEVDSKLQDGQKISLGNIELKVIHTPGHTRGSICLYEEKSKSLFSGDTVFSMGVGRTDFPGGNWDELKRSIEKLIQLHRNKGIDKIYPGHGPMEEGNQIEEIYKIYFQE